MVKQGDIILVDFAPTKGREQSGKRPALVLSNTKYNYHSGFVIACPITSSTKPMNIRVSLGEGTKTKGDVLCEQIRLIDLQEREYEVVESVTSDLLSAVYKVVNALILPSESAKSNKRDQ